MDRYVCLTCPFLCDFYFKCVNFNVKIKWLYFKINFNNCLQLLNFKAVDWYCIYQECMRLKAPANQPKAGNSSYKLCLLRITYKCLLGTSEPSADGQSMYTLLYLEQVLLDWNSLYWGKHTWLRTPQKSLLG